MTTLKGLKGLMIVAALLAGGTSLAMAQNAVTRYLDARYLEILDMVAPEYAQPVAQPGYVGAEEPRLRSGNMLRVTHHRTLYMYAPPRRSSHHAQKIVPAPNAQ
jgi:hypothetical protein